MVSSIQSAKKGGRISKAEKERLQRDAEEQKQREMGKPA